MKTISIILCRLLWLSGVLFVFASVAGVTPPLTNIQVKSVKKVVVKLNGMPSTNVDNISNVKSAVELDWELIPSSNLAGDDTGKIPNLSADNESTNIFISSYSIIYNHRRIYNHVCQGKYSVT